MPRDWKVCLAVLCSIAVAAVLMSIEEKPAQARTKYLKPFLANYKNIEKEAKKAKCNVCHYGKKRKNCNDYGEAMKKNFAKNKRKKNEKNAEIIKKVLKKTEKIKSSVKGKTFGDLIKDGKLPGKAPKQKKE